MYIQAKDGCFILNGNQILFRGFAIGSWMNIENFMIRIPGTEKSIRNIFTKVYGEENASQFFDNFLTNFIAEEDFEFLKELGVNMLRIPLNYRHFIDDQNPNRYSEDAFTHLDRILKLCKKYEIYAVLDMHSTPGGQNPDFHSGSDTGVALFWEYGALRQVIINLWVYIAERYVEEKIIAGFDLVNEPSFVASKTAFNDFYESLISNIRQVNKKHILFLEGDNWARDFSIFDKLEGKQIALSFHFYPGQHVSLFGESEKRKLDLEKKILVYTSLREKTGMPLWIGETGGLFPKNKLDDGIKLIKEGIDLFEKHRISWSLWTYKDARTMSLVYPQVNTPWMKMGYEFREKWQLKENRNATIAKDIFSLIENKLSYTIDKGVKRPLFFRIFSLLDELHTNYLLEPRLANTPWEEMKDYPQSFLWENCEYWTELADLVRSYSR